MTDDRSALRVVPLAAVTFDHQQMVITIAVGQPLTMLHRVAYDQGAYILEVNDLEQPVRAYHRDQRSDA